MTGESRVAIPWLCQLAFLALFFSVGCNWTLPGQPKAADRYVPPQDIKDFSVLFQQNCAGCHGVDGRLGPAPPLNDKLFLALISRAELQRIITEGRTDTLMPAFARDRGGQLTARQVQVLAEGIKQNWGSAESAPRDAPPLFTSSKSEAIPAAADTGEALPIAPRPVAGSQPPNGNVGKKEKGLQVYAQACASCHGDQGQGGHDGSTADAKPVGAINDPVFLALISDQALRRLVITGRPDLRMPDYADPRGRPETFRPLRSQDVADIMALLASWKQGGAPKRKDH
jgi:mono/diheme cytochrome c family protein